MSAPKPTRTRVSLTYDDAELIRTFASERGDLVDNLISHARRRITEEYGEIAEIWTDRDSSTREITVHAKLR